MLTLARDCAAEVIGTAFFDVEMDALDYSIEDDGSLKLSDRPYLQVFATLFLPDWAILPTCGLELGLEGSGGAEGNRGGGCGMDFRGGVEAGR